MAESIMDKRAGCWLCGTFGSDVNPLEDHHCWHGTANRKMADWDGLKVRLCRICHRRVHSDRESDLKLMQAAELAWLMHYGKQGKDVPDFIKRYGKNVLE